MDVIETIIANQSNVKKIILSDSNENIKKIIIRPIELKGNMMWQIERYIGTQVFHENVGDEGLKSLDYKIFKQISIEMIGKTIYFTKKNDKYKSKEVKNNIEKSNINLAHNKTKSYLINEGDNVPALVDLGIFTMDKKIVRSKYDKFKQINRFIEIVDDVIQHEEKDDFTILDFGCGKSYLTFLLYYYFVEIKHKNVKIIGYDLKADVVKNCNEIAEKYDYKNLKFYVSDVAKDELFSGHIDMVISLHACDTATDYALNYAIQHKVKYIFSVPCCQHEINLSIKPGGDFDLLMKDGLILERFSALLTDAIRVEILRSLGYDVDVIEFVDFAHSPKNLMIRATYKGGKKSMQNIEKLIDKYHFSQTLFNLVKNK